MNTYLPLSAALDAASDGIAVFDADDRLVECNAAYRAIFAPLADLLVPGAAFADLVRASVARGFTPVPAEGAEAAIVKRMAQHCCLHGAFEIARGERILLMRESRVANGGILQLVTDVTTLRAEAAREQQAEKMAALATLSGGLAHDVNNALAMIRGHVELAGVKIGADHPAATQLARIVANVDRAAGLTRSLLNFSRHRSVAHRPVDVAGLVGDLQAPIRAMLPSEIGLEIATSEEQMIEGDVDALRRAILQIVVNARDAMPRGGTLHLAVDEVPPLPGLLPAGVPNVSHVRVTIADTGIGMDEATRQRVFEPFFTTKQPGGGAGLGLAIAYGVAVEHGGRIAVDSRPGAGTIVRLYLPCSTLAEENDTDALRATEAAAPRRILLAEDEPELRELLRLGLEAQGHAVTVAENGAVARELARDGEFDLLVTDIVMPEMDGLRLAADLTAERPDLRVVYMTGDPGRIRDAETELARNAIVLWKPFAPSHLAEIVARAA